MPKAKPLPTDPTQRAKVLRNRELSQARMVTWRARHPEKRRIMGRHTVRLHRQRLKVRAEMRQAA